MKGYLFPSRLILALVVIGGLTLALTVSPLAPVKAATPASGSVSQTQPQVTWQFDPVVEYPAGGIPPTGCPGPASTGPKNCDQFSLTVVPGTVATGEQETLTITTSWDDPTIPTDLDMFVVDPTGATVCGPGSPDTSFTGPSHETCSFTNPVAGTWLVQIVNYNNPTPTGVPSTGQATLSVGPQPSPGCQPNCPSPTIQPGDPSFTNYPTNNNPNDTSDVGGEVGIGADWTTPSGSAPNTVMFQDTNPKTWKVQFTDPNNATTPATATWTDVTFATQSVTFDPIGYVDHPYPSEPGYVGSAATPCSTTTVPPCTAHRWFATQLLTSAAAGVGGVGCSSSAFSDDMGGTGSAADWTQSQGCGQPGGDDHESLGAGPYSAGGAITSNPVYPHAVYYCAQESNPGSTAFCARSDDGGATFPNSFPIYSFAGSNLPTAPGSCIGLHGHVRVAPNGMVMVPNEACEDSNGVLRPAFAASTDNGVTWTVYTVPDGLSIDNHHFGGDPSVAAGAGNTVYFGYAGDDGSGNALADIAVYHPSTQTWDASHDVGAAFGIKNIEFPEVIAGDDNRAAYAFLGTTATGNDQSSTFPGVWYLYVAFTYDGGKTWTTVNATPNNPVQRGCIWNGGGSNVCRNLLDFNDITVDRSGRVLVAYSDGCIATCVTTPGPKGQGPFSSLGTIARQNCGTTGANGTFALSKGLFAAYDTSGFLGCSAPTVARVTSFLVRRAHDAVTLSWRMAGPGGVARFDIFTGTHRLNARAIRPHAGRLYIYRVRRSGRDHFTLRITLTSGGHMDVYSSRS